MTHAVLEAYELDDNSSQALNAPIDLSAVLEVDAVAVAVPTVNTRRLSPVLPTPSLDSRGMPT